MIRYFGYVVIQIYVVVADSYSRIYLSLPVVPSAQEDEGRFPRKRFVFHPFYIFLHAYRLFIVSFAGFYLRTIFKLSYFLYNDYNAFVICYVCIVYKGGYLYFMVGVHTYTTILVGKVSFLYYYYFGVPHLRARIS